MLSLLWQVLETGCKRRLENRREIPVCIYKRLYWGILQVKTLTSELPWCITLATEYLLNIHSYAI